MLRVFILLVAIIFSNFALIAKLNNKVYFYQPVKVTLTGKLFLKTFPGPPNYESVKHGDLPEKGWYLKLDKKIDVIINEKKRVPENINDENERAVDVIQLVLPYEGYHEYQKKKNFKVGSKITLSGTLYRRFTGHHHARVLLRLAE
jgi:hypothetical protein